jgi:hypothetical protein
MAQVKYIYVCIKFSNPAWGQRDPANKIAYVETKVLKSWKAVVNMLNGFLGEHDYKDFGDQYIDRNASAVEIIRVIR